jgi:hypothetical protein
MLKAGGVVLHCRTRLLCLHNTLGMLFKIALREFTGRCL